MTAPEFPLDEALRLRALKALEVLDTDPEERFDRITRLANRMFNVPIAAVSLVDAEREWFKSCYGLDTTEGPRSVSFCGHTILDAEPLVVEDATADERFADNPQVIEDGIRFYAGVPVHAPDGFPVGAFCIKDRVPRHLAPEQLAALRDLAAIAEAELSVASLAELRTQLDESARRRRQIEDDRDQFFELSLDMFCIAGFDGYFRHLNPAWQRTLGYDLHELRDRPFIEFVHPDDQQATALRMRERPPSREIVAEASARDQGGVCVSFENRYRHRDGSYRWLHWNASALTERGLIYAVARDITDVKRIEQELRAARDEAETANRTKSEFLANMSHELRTPLNSVIGFSSVLLENRADDLNETDLQFLGRIRDSGQHLLELINDVLDISKIEAGKLDLVVEPVKLTSLVTEAVSHFDSIAAESGLDLRVELPDERVGEIRADPMRLKQVLYNLVGNAIKFTLEGTVTVRLLAGHEGRAQSIEVEDTGVGIPADKLDQVFEAFRQAEASTTRRFGGTGLGLSISRRLCRLMGLDLSATSVEGEGSTFTITLDSAQAHPSDLDEAHPEGFVAAESDAGPRVLVIDDEADSRLLLSSTLSKLGCAVATAPTVEEGLRLARARRPDLITLDLMMPGIDGWEGLRLLKADPELRSVPVVVASIVGHENRRSLAGAAAVLDKPVNLETFRAILDEHVPDTGGRVFLVDAGGGEEVRPLLTDDGRRVTSAPATDEVYAAITEFGPDLIVMSVPAFGPDAVGFLERVSLLPGLAGTPVVVVGADDAELSELRRVNSQVVAVVYEGDEVASTLRRALRTAAPAA